MRNTQKNFFEIYTAFMNNSTDLKKDTIDISPTRLKSKNMSVKT